MEFTLENIFHKLFGYPVFKEKKRGYTLLEFQELEERQTSTRFFRFLHFIEDTIPIYIHSRIVYRYYDYKYTLKCLFTRPDLIRTGLPFNHYFDTSYVLMHGMFHTFINYIEKDQPWGKDGHLEEAWKKTVEEDKEFAEFYAEDREKMLKIYNYLKVHRKELVNEIDKLYEENSKHYDRSMSLLQNMNKERNEDMLKLINLIDDKEKELSEKDIFYMKQICEVSIKMY